MPIDPTQPAIALAPCQERGHFKKRLKMRAYVLTGKKYVHIFE
jgi:hypothetical protein